MNEGVTLNTSDYTQSEYTQLIGFGTDVISALTGDLWKSKSWTRQLKVKDGSGAVGDLTALLSFTSKLFDIIKNNGVSTQQVMNEGVALNTSDYTQSEYTQLIGFGTDVISALTGDLAKSKSWTRQVKVKDGSGAVGDLTALLSFTSKLFDIIKNNGVSTQQVMNEGVTLNTSDYTTSEYTQLIGFGTDVISALTGDLSKSKSWTRQVKVKDGSGAV